MPNELLEDIQFKARNGAQISVDKAEGVVECFVSGIGNKDSVGDIVLPGAFNESLKRRKPRVVWGHSWNDPIGKVLEIYEVPSSDPRLPQKMKSAGIGGLFAKVQFNLGAEKGREAFANVAFFGEEQEWSIGYKTLQATFDPVQQANMLKEVELYEVSPVLHGANQLTGTISVKDGEEGACGPNSCECGTKNLIASEPDIQTEEETSLIFEKGHMMGSMPMRMIILPMGKPSDDSDEDDASSRDIWSRGEAGPVDPEKRMELAKEIHSRTKVPIKIIEATENMVVFLRKMVDGTTRMYRMAYHHPSPGKYMFGKPARVKPQMMYAPVTPNMPASPMGPMAVKPNPIQGKETDEVKTDPFLIPCQIEEVFEVKETLQPILEYYDVKVTPSAGGLICSDYPPDFREAADTAVKALGTRLGRGGGLGKVRRAGRALQPFDPKAWDGDNDGLVQEGTPFERPAIPGVNSFNDGMSSEGMRSTSRWNSTEKFYAPKADLPSRAIRDMPSNERTRRMNELREKIDYLDEEIDLLTGEGSEVDPDLINSGSDKYDPEIASVYGTPEELSDGLEKAKSKIGDLEKELSKHKVAATIHGWETGKQSKIQLSKDIKDIELELTSDEINSLKSHIKAMIDGDKARRGQRNRKKAANALINYDQKLTANKKGVVKITPDEYENIIHWWDTFPSPDSSQVHSKTGRDILEFAALSEGKYRSPQLDLGDDKYAGFGSKRINNGAPPDITPQNQKQLLAEGPPDIRQRGMLEDLEDRGSGSPRRWEYLKNRQLIRNAPPSEKQPGRAPGRPPGPNPRIRRPDGRGGFTYARPSTGKPPGPQPKEGPSAPGEPPRIGRAYTPSTNITASGKRRGRPPTNPPGKIREPKSRRREKPSTREVLAANREDQWNVVNWDAYEGHPGAPSADNPAGTREYWDQPVKPKQPSRKRPGQDMTLGEQSLHSEGMRSTRDSELPRGSSVDLGKKKQRGRPMGTEGVKPEREQGLTWNEVKPDNWDQLSTEDKFSLLNVELTPKRSGIAPIHHTRIYNELDKILERQEKRRNRSEGNFESLAERRARRGGINMPRSVAKREETSKEPQRRTADSARKDRKKDHRSLQTAANNATNYIGKNPDSVRDEHIEIWDDMGDILSESDDLTMSQLQALDSLFESYLSGQDDLSPEEGQLYAMALSRKNKIEDLLSLYEGDKFISQGDTATVRRLGASGPEGADIMESGDLPDLFSSDGMRSIRQNRGKLPGTATEEYVRSRRRQGMRSQQNRSREEKITDLRNLWRNAEATGDSSEMDRLERQLRELNAGPPVNRRTPKVGRARPDNRQTTGGNFRNTGNREGMRSERAGRTQITGEATWFKKIEDSLDKEIRMAREDNDKRTADALRTLKDTLSRQESGKTGDKRTNAGTLTVTQDEIDEMLDALMNVLDRQMETDGSRTDMFAQLIEKLSSAGLSTFITRDTNEIQSRTREATNEAGRTVRIPDSSF